VNEIQRVHLVYPEGNRISTPDVIGRNLKLTLEKFYGVKTYNYDQLKTIHPGNGDVLIEHWHPNLFTVFRMSAYKKGWKRVLALAPLYPDTTGWHNAFGNKIIEKCGRYLAITGNAWMKRLKDSSFQHWRTKIVHIYLAVDRADFHYIIKNFNLTGYRRFLYIGHTSWCKNRSFLEKLAQEIPLDRLLLDSWEPISLKKIKGLGKFDFSKQEAKNTIKKSMIISLQ
jgi:hypothetical protein